MVIWTEPKKLKVIISSNVKYYRFSNKITQEELAERCGLSARYISDIENDKGNIPVDTLEKISIEIYQKELICMNLIISKRTLI